MSLLLRTALLFMIAGLGCAENDQPPKYAPARSDYGRVHRAWEYKGDLGFEVPAGQKLIAAEIDLPAPTEGTFDLDDIDLFDADTGRWFGSDPYIQRLNARGELIDGNDPEVKDQAEYRGIFIWVAAASVRRVNFGYWGEMLYTKGVTLTPSETTVPRPKIRVVGIQQGEPIDKEYRRYVMRLDAQSWSRVETPEHYTLYASSAAEDRQICDSDAWIELDADNRPRTGTLRDRPYYEASRHFLIEFWCALGATPDALNRFGEKTPLPPFRTIDISDATLRALGAAERNEFSRHRPNEWLKGARDEIQGTGLSGRVSGIVGLHLSTQKELPWYC